VKNKLPCHDCIAYAICKGLANDLIRVIGEKHEGNESMRHHLLMVDLKPRCSLLLGYPRNFNTYTEYCHYIKQIYRFFVEGVDYGGC